MRHRRRVRVPPDLTSLFDVLFIVIFAALIRAAAVQAQAAPQPAPTPTPPRPPVQLDPASLKARALADLDASLRARPAIIVRVSQAGKITSLASPERTLALDTPLLEPSPDPDVKLTYLGDRSSDLRLCRVAALDLGVADLAKYLRGRRAQRAASADLPHALFDEACTATSIAASSSSTRRRGAGRARRGQTRGAQAMTSPAAQEVLRELTRRRRRRRVLGLAMVAALIAAAILYLRFGGGFGFGFGGESGRGESAGTGSAGSAAPQRCAIKVTAAGLVVDGAPPTRDVAAVVATCKAGSGAVISVVGDAREGDFAELKRALDTAGVPVEQRVR